MFSPRLAAPHNFCWIYLVGVLLKMLRMRLRDMLWIVHLNITERGADSACDTNRSRTRGDSAGDGAMPRPGGHIATRQPSAPSTSQFPRIKSMPRSPVYHRWQRSGRTPTESGMIWPVRIDFISWLPQQLFDPYESHDLFVFPSLHDSAGFVVLKALSRGLPVVCLNLGGPEQIATPELGIVVDTAGRNTAQVAALWLKKSRDFLSEPARLATLSAGAIANRVAAFHDRVTNFIRLQGVRERDKDVSQAHT